MECLWCKSFETTNLPDWTKVKCFICWKELVKWDSLRMLAEMFWGNSPSNPFSDLLNKK